MNLIYLQPTDVLFFKDGRPMSGSSSGHGAAWPLPDVVNHALHAALHRADLEKQTGQKLHSHRRGCSGNYSTDENHRDRKFGSLVTAGPFPVKTMERSNRPEPIWFFPRPKDAQQKGCVDVSLRPVAAVPGVDAPWRTASSLPVPLKYAVANTQPPSKNAGIESWISAAAFESYLQDSMPNPTRLPGSTGMDLLRDTDLADTEHQIGIGINPETGTTTESQFYSAHYLRLREEIRLGLLAEAMDKIEGDSLQKRDLIRILLNGHPEQIIVGGQQRLCTAERRDVDGALPLPKGLTSDFNEVNHDGRKVWLVKWVLLSPAIWPAIPDKDEHGNQIKDRNDHPIQKHGGGWLPNWVAEADCRFAGESVKSGSVLLLDGPGPEKANRKKLTPGKRIRAKLVAAIVPKPIVVTGWALANDTDRPVGGAKSTHLAVPAGAVYYFEAETEQDALALANSLNWHGATDGKKIMNRRSTLMGEKGFGLGVCGTWTDGSCA